MPKKILLISTSSEKNKDYDEKEIVKNIDDAGHYSLGLAYLYSVLEIDNHEIQLLFLNNYEYKDCKNKIKEILEKFSPDIVGFQMLSFNRVSTYRMVEYIHENHPHINQIIGGVHATIMYQQIIEKCPYAIIILGEGEVTMPALVKELSKPRPDLNSIDGIAFSANGGIKKTRERELIKNLDEIPFPKHEIFFKGNRDCGDILTTRGCPNHCSFCCLNSISRGRVRMRSVENIIKEIEWMIQQFPQMKNIWIYDDTFFVDNQRVINFCDEIIKRNIKINFACNARMKPISEEMVKKLEQAHFANVLIGLESGDNDILKRCHKGITQDDVINAYKLFAKTRIVVNSNLIIGLPGESAETITNTANLLKKLQKIKYVPNYEEAVGYLSIFPGTEIYEIAKKAGAINDEYWLTDKNIPYFTVENSYEQLENLFEILKNNISPLRALTTWEGFKAQFNILPYYFKYIFRKYSIKITRFILPEKFINILKKI